MLPNKYDLINISLIWALWGKKRQFLQTDLLPWPFRDLNKFFKFHYCKFALKLLLVNFMMIFIYVTGYLAVEELDAAEIEGEEEKTIRTRKGIRQEIVRNKIRKLNGVGKWG